MNSLNSMLLGGIAMAGFIAALFFMRFWYRTRDRFFAFFSIAFAVDAIDRVLLALYWQSETDAPLYFMIRLLAYGLIVIAIIDKNWERDASSRLTKRRE
jgi:hypothetical protein